MAPRTALPAALVAALAAATVAGAPARAQDVTDDPGGDPSDVVQVIDLGDIGDLLDDSADDPCSTVDDPTADDSTADDTSVDDPSGDDGSVVVTVDDGADDPTADDPSSDDSSADDPSADDSTADDPCAEDDTAEEDDLGTAKQKLRVSRSTLLRGKSFKAGVVAMSRAGKVSARLRLPNGKQLGSFSRTVKRAGDVTIAVKVGKVGRRVLRKAKHADRAVLVVKTTPRGRKARTVTHTVKLG